MDSDEASDRFLCEGLFRYAGARATVVSFEEAIEEKVVEIVTRAASTLVNGKNVIIDARNVCNGDEGGRVAYTHFRGEFAGDPVTWELGIWWQHPSDGDEVCVYAECWKGPKELTHVVWAKPPDDPTHRWTPYKGGLNLSLTRDEALEDVFKLLVSEVAKQSAQGER